MARLEPVKGVFCLYFGLDKESTRGCFLGTLGTWIDKYLDHLSLPKVSQKLDFSKVTWSAPFSNCAGILPDYTVWKDLAFDPPNEVQMPCNLSYWKANILNLKRVANNPNHDRSSHLRKVDKLGPHSIQHRLRLRNPLFWPFFILAEGVTPFWCI